MKRFILAMAVILFCSAVQAQIKIGIKAGANFANLEGASFDTKTKTGFHFGAVAAVKLPGNFALQPELLYSSQGAEVNIENVKNINYDYVAVPVMLKYYLIPDLFNVELGPQFSFLIHDNNQHTFDAADSSTFDFAALGGLGLDLGTHFFVQGRYVLGLTDASTSASISNRVIQFSLGYKF